MYDWLAFNHPGCEKGLLLTFSTGTDQETRTFLQEHGVPSLAKPFEVADLISHVRTLSQREGKHAPNASTPAQTDAAKERDRNISNDPEDKEAKDQDKADEKASATGA
jgi:DNA-binding response OmpR family regulator